MATVVLQTEEAYFPKADKFIPERWLERNPTQGSDKVSMKPSNPFIYLPFGFGARSCIGRRFAEMEVETLVARFVVILVFIRKFRKKPFVNRMKTKVTHY